MSFSLISASFLAISIAVEQHFCWLMAKKKPRRGRTMGRKWISGRRGKKQKLIFCCCSNVQFTKKSTGHWPYHENTFIVSRCFASYTANIPVFKYIFLRCAVSRLFRLDLCFLFFYEKYIFFSVVVTCNNFFLFFFAKKTHTNAF